VVRRRYAARVDALVTQPELQEHSPKNRDQRASGRSLSLENEFAMGTFRLAVGVVCRWLILDQTDTPRPCREFQWHPVRHRRLSHERSWYTDSSLLSHRLHLTDMLHPCARFRSTFVGTSLLFHPHLPDRLMARGACFVITKKRDPANSYRYGVTISNGVVSGGG